MDNITESSNRIHSLNIKLWAKREETEKNIMKHHAERKNKLKKKKELLIEESAKTQEMQHESSSLSYRSVAISGTIASLQIKINKLKCEVQETLCKIDEIIPKRMQANMVLEKEELCLEPYYRRMEDREKELQEFWENSDVTSDNEILLTKKKKLLERQEVLEDQIDQLKQNCTLSDINKLTEECMILRKRNAAFLRRKTRILEELEKQINEKKQELTRAKRNITFRFS